MDKEPNEDGHLEFRVKTLDEVYAIIKQYGAEGEEFQGGSEHLDHICHVKSPYGLLYFYAPTEQIARDIWEYWFPEAREAREEAEKEENNHGL